MLKAEAVVAEMLRVSYHGVEYAADTHSVQQLRPNWHSEDGC